MDVRCSIVKAALSVMLEEGAPKITARKIAKIAGVSLGTVTYYFSSVESIVVSAEEMLGDEFYLMLRVQLEEAKSREQFIGVVCDLVVGDRCERACQIVSRLCGFEVRYPGIRSLARSWTAVLSEALSVRFSESTAQALIVLLTGLAVQRSMGGSYISRHEAFELISRIADI